MLLNKKLSLRLSLSSFDMRIFLVLPLLSLLMSCTTTHIPGLDRILFADSSAKVGPIVAADEQNPVVASDVASTTPNNDSATNSANKFPAPIGKPKPELTPTLESESAVQGTDLKTVSAQEANEEKALAKNVKPTNKQAPTSSKKIAAQTPIEKDINELAIDYGNVVGKVVLIGEKGKLLPAKGTLVTLTPKTAINDEQNNQSKVHIIDMEDKEYQPRYSTINAGDQVVFVNKDNIQHNVFSSSGSNAFDLGTYGSGLKRAVTLKEPGVVKIYCNIHAEMATFIAVGNKGLSVKADDQGSYNIKKVLPGTYELTAWNIRGETKQTIQVKANQTVNLTDQIDTVAFKIKSHKNKFGGEYSKNSTLFEDEFY